MGYSKNRAVLEARRDSLAELEAGRACRWHPVVNADNTAYRIREALYIGSLYPDEYPAIASAHRNFSIVVVGSHTVEARLKTERVVPIPVSGESGVVSFGAEPALPKHTAVVGLTTAAQIIEAWKMHLPLNDKMNFPQTVLPIEELIKLDHWTKEWRPPLMMMVGEGFITIALYDADAARAGIVWEPPTKPSAPERDYGI